MKEFVRGAIVCLLLAPAFCAGVADRPPPVRGIDFYAHDRLHVPLPPTRNLLPNPSFESGLRYWRFNEHGSHRAVPGGVPGQEIVFGGLFGRCALKLNAVPGKRTLFSFPTPLEDGKTYTLSVYAKSSSGAKCDFTLGIAPAATSRKFDGAYPGQFFVFGDITNKLAKFKAGGEWRRFSRTFTGRGCGLAFSVSGGDGLLVDGFQLEEGDTATEYTEAPVQARLVTSDPRNCVPSGNALGARIELAGRPGVTAVTGWAVPCLLFPPQMFYGVSTTAAPRLAGAPDTWCLSIQDIRGLSSRSIRLLGRKMEFTAHGCCGS